MSVKYFAWDDAKNARLKADRGIGFDDVVFHIERGDLLDILEHENSDRYAGQRIFVVQLDDYAYLVPFVEDEHSVAHDNAQPLCVLGARCRDTGQSVRENGRV